MKRTIILSLFFFFSIGSVFAQAQFLADNMGRPFRNVRYTNISGSPYFNDNFQKGIVRFGSASKEAKVFVQYDQVIDLLSYKDKISDEEVKEFVIIASDFKLINLVTGDTTSFVNIPEAGKSVYYQVLAEGKKYNFLVKEFKKIVDVSTYNSANKEKRVSANTKYFVRVNADGSLKPLSLDKKSVNSFFAGNEAKADAFMAKNKYSYKNKDDVTSLFSYMDSN